MEERVGAPDGGEGLDGPFMRPSAARETTRDLELPRFGGSLGGGSLEVAGMRFWEAQAVVVVARADRAARTSGVAMAGVGVGRGGGDGVVAGYFSVAVSEVYPTRERRGEK